VVRARAKLLLALMVQLEVLLPVESYSEEFFRLDTEAELIRRLPEGKIWTTIPKLCG
jgi:hypothetical protein